MTLSKKLSSFCGGCSIFKFGVLNCPICQSKVRKEGTVLKSYRCLECGWLVQIPSGLGNEVFGEKIDKPKTQSENVLDYKQCRKCGCFFFPERSIKNIDYEQNYCEKCNHNKILIVKEKGQ